ncbi:hypothetical protein JZ751_023880 [Albula glossodonta]|uniref:Uncharacterized protein n=1 Tax=Albula glossodonta TaxID=121402 RepID=A0A8T2NH51_9TELE|nr:hypothetical protein JZ751_023880 [Albula glossodonta]
MVLKRTLVEPGICEVLKEKKDRQSSTRQPSSSPSSRFRKQYGGFEEEQSEALNAERELKLSDRDWRFLSVALTTDCCYYSTVLPSWLREGKWGSTRPIHFSLIPPFIQEDY